VRPRRDFRKVKTVLSSSPSEGGLWSSETKSDRRTVPRPMLFVLARRLQNKGYNPEKCVLCSIPGEDGFCSSVNKHDRGTKPRTQLFVSAERLQEQRLQTRIESWVRAPVKILGLGIIIFSCDIQRHVSKDQAYDKLSGLIRNVSICRVSPQLHCRDSASDIKFLTCFYFIRFFV
jgi:hypothetical protein